jgi:hypothetical protein
MVDIVGILNWRSTFRTRRDRCLWCWISTYDRFGSSSDPSLNGHLHYPNDIDKSLNETDTDKIRKYLSDCNNNPPNTVSFIPGIISTSGRLHSEFIRLLFLQTHRETDRLFVVSGVQLAQSTSGLFHFLHTVFSSHLKTKVDSTLTTSSLGVPVSRSHNKQQAFE